MIKREDILHKTTYVWKENEKYTSIIKNDGSRVILNKKLNFPTSKPGINS